MLLRNTISLGLLRGCSLRSRASSAKANSGTRRISRFGRAPPSSHRSLPTARTRRFAELRRRTSVATELEGEGPRSARRGESAESTEPFSFLLQLAHFFPSRISIFPHPLSHARFNPYIMVALLALLAFVVPALATFSQGSLNLTRDWQLHYSRSVFATSEAFCKAFRAECVDYVGALGDHHQVS